MVPECLPCLTVRFSTNLFSDKNCLGHSDPDHPSMLSHQHAQEHLSGHKERNARQFPAQPHTVNFSGNCCGSFCGFFCFLFWVFFVCFLPLLLANWTISTMLEPKEAIQSADVGRVEETVTAGSCTAGAPWLMWAKESSRLLTASQRQRCDTGTRTRTP